MPIKHKIVFFIILITLSSAAFGGQEDRTARLEADVASLTELVKKLSARIEQLENATSFEREIAAAAPTSQPVQTRPAVQSSGGFQNMNPDISVAGVAIGKASTDKRDPDRNTIGLHESELVLTKSVSPYSRANLTVGFHGDHSEVEEGYIDVVHLLPEKIEARIGKFLVPAGFLNTVHSHDWPMVARPLSMRYFTGDEGFAENGLSLSMPIDLRSKTYVKASADVLNGSNEGLFNDGQTRVVGGRIMSNTPLNDRDDMNLGLNLHQGAWNTAGDLDSRLVGADVMLRRRFNQHDRFLLWGEWMWNRREQLGRGDLTAAGYYLGAMYTFKKDHNWHVGIEYDCSEKPGDSRFNAIARSAFLGYWLTENDRLQLQFRNVRDPFEQTVANELLFEVIWGMGPHKPHLANF
ncbi:MAG TPA: hypothetical protein PLU72_02925 [Candidatus Ozemobacteraceae bacterium]|nr:hypothetical protein [Candidatus Ozemobacteraceae bacterium]